MSSYQGGYQGMDGIAGTGRTDMASEHLVASVISSGSGVPSEQGMKRKDNLDLDDGTLMKRQRLDDTLNTHTTDDAFPVSPLLGPVMESEEESRERARAALRIGLMESEEESRERARRALMIGMQDNSKDDDKKSEFLSGESPLLGGMAEPEPIDELV